ncbi:hypothetical protein [uncultured Paraglaciecola sp.]|mgnify:CR=1 FL=1|uniref:DUF7678 domain-containing protein n=1 Tax=uncultured Paraglaciecola sp. TaxID=1765024 RepID=UPI002627BD52|nr:hypothetical protein [uncultured Paraglaciecola sp.]
MAQKLHTYKDTRKKNGWISGVVNGLEYEAKVYDEVSEYGINSCRVSKLRVVDKSTPIYNYDRGLDFNNANEYQMADINLLLAWLNNLEPVFETEEA